MPCRVRTKRAFVSRSELRLTLRGCRPDPIPECETQLRLLTHPESRHLRRASPSWLPTLPAISSFTAPSRVSSRSAFTPGATEARI